MTSLIYLFLPQKTRATIAIKAVSRQKLTTKLLENLESEISILKAISHRNVVSLEDCFVSPPICFASGLPGHLLFRPLLSSPHPFLSYPRSFLS